MMIEVGVITILTVLISFFIISCLYKERSIVFVSVMAILLDCLVYELSSAILFFIDKYSIIKCISLNLFIVVVASLCLLLCRKTPTKPIFSKKDAVFLIATTCLTIFMSSPLSGLCGLWRDDGGYQIKALHLINGDTGNKVTLSYNSNLTDEEQAWYVESLNNQLHYLWKYDKIHGVAEPENEELSFYNRVFHNIPTFPSFLGLFGILFGCAKMQLCQLVFYFLIQMTLYFIFEKVHSNTKTEIVGLTIAMFSPQIVFFTHTAFVELYLILMVIVCCYGLMDYEESAWLIGMSVGGFSLMHISAYLFVPAVIICLWIKYMSCKDYKVISQVYYCILFFVVGYIYMSAYNKDYVFSNYTFLKLIFKFIDSHTILTIVVTLFLIVAIIINIALKNGLVFFNTNIFNSTISVIVPLFLWYVCIKKGFSYINPNPNSKVTVNIFYAVFSTGIGTSIALIYDYIYRLKNKNGSLAEYTWLLVLIDYSVILNCFLMPSVKYVYYFSRYNAVYWLLLVIGGLIVINNLLNKSVGIVLLIINIIGVLFFIKPDYFLKTTYVDTIMSWEAYEGIVSTLNNENSALVLGNDELDYNRHLYMAFRQGGLDVFFQNKDWPIEQQLQGLKNAGYNNVYLLTDREQSLGDIIFTIDENYDYTILDRFDGDPLFKYPVKGKHMNRLMYVYSF